MQRGALLSFQHQICQPAEQIRCRRRVYDDQRTLGHCCLSNNCLRSASTRAKASLSSGSTIKTCDVCARDEPSPPMPPHRHMWHWQPAKFWWLGKLLRPYWCTILPFRLSPFNGLSPRALSSAFSGSCLLFGNPPDPHSASAAMCGGQRGALRY